MLQPEPNYPELSVLVVNYNTADLIKPMIESLRAAASALGEFKIIFVDNASRDQSLDVIRNFDPEIELITNSVNIGFGRANNQCLDLAQGRYVLLLNTDAFVAPDTLTKTLAYMESHPRCGVLGVRLVGRDGVLQPSCRYFPTVFNTFLFATGIGAWFPGVRAVDDMTWDHASVRECDWVPGCFYLVRREVINQVGLFDPRFFLYFEEVDHCRAVKAAGWSVTYFPDTTVVHIGGESAKSDCDFAINSRQISVLQIESELLYFRKHAGLAGLLGHLILTVVAAVILASKALLKQRGFGHSSSQWHHVLQVFSLARRTGFGARATR